MFFVMKSFFSSLPVYMFYANNLQYIIEKLLSAWDSIKIKIFPTVKKSTIRYFLFDRWYGIKCRHIHVNQRHALRFSFFAFCKLISCFEKFQGSIHIYLNYNLLKHGSSCRIDSCLEGKKKRSRMLFSNRNKQNPKIIILKMQNIPLFLSVEGV